MIEALRTVEDILNPCLIPETNRQQAYLEYTQTISAGGTIEFQLGGQDYDLTESYCTTLFEMNVTDAGTPSEYDLDLTGGTAGSFCFSYAGTNSAVLQYNATDSQIRTALLGMPAIGGEGYDVTVTVVSPNRFTIEIDENTFGLVGDGLSIKVLTAFVGTPAFPFSLVSVGSLTYPRLDYLAPVITTAKVFVGGSDNVVNISNYQFLTSLYLLLRPASKRYGMYNNNNAFVNGSINFGQQIGIEIPLDPIDIMKKIMPLKTMNNTQMRLQLTLSPNDVALIQGPSGGGKYTLTNTRLHFHTLNLEEKDTTAIYNIWNSGGLVVPFKDFEMNSGAIGGGASNANIVLNPSTANMLGLLAVIYDVGRYENAQSQSKTANWLRNGMTSYQLRVGSQYYPLDPVRMNSWRDVVSPIEELESLLNKIERNVEDGFDRQIYFNYTGDVTGSDSSYRTPVPAFYANVFPSFVMGLSTTNAPTSNLGISCHYNIGIPGINVSSNPNVALALNGMSNANPTQCIVFVATQSYVTISSRGIRYVA